MELRIPPGIELSVPYSQERESVSSARYRWNCWNRGKKPFVLVQWTHSGQGIFDCERGRVPVPADHAFIAVIPERSSYFYATEGGEPWVFSWINFYGTLSCTLFTMMQLEFGPVVAISPRGASATALRRLLTRKTQSGEYDRFQISGQAYNFFLEWWREASQPVGSAESRLVRAIRFSRENFREPLGVKQMAAEAGMSREHFSRVFTAFAGESPSASLQRLRLDEACMLLRETELPLREIAMRSGFYSERHLMRNFQRLLGSNPSQYRRFAKAKPPRSNMAKEARSR